MKSLKPIETETTATLIATDIVEELKAELNALSSANKLLQNQIDALKSQLSSSTISKQNGTFTTLNATNGSIANISSSKVDTDTVTAKQVTTDTIQSASINGTTLSAGTINGTTATISSFTVTDAKADTIAATKLTADQVDTPYISADKVAAQQVNTAKAVVDELEVNTFNTPSTLKSNRGEFNEMVTDELQAAKAVVEEANEVTANIERLFNRDKYYVTDETDGRQFISFGEPNDGSNGTDDYRFIEIPEFVSGFYRIDARKDDGSYFAVTFINTERAPIVEYDKVLEGDVDEIYYDTVYNRFYVKTYASGKLYWSNDSKTTRGAPQIFAELPIDKEAETTLHYKTKGKSRLVIMGDNSLDYGLTVQGVLEANLVKESAQYHQLFFYGNSLSALYNFANKYLTYEDSEGNKHYTNSELAGYLYHTDDSYRDPDNTETEALEKISYDGSTITFTIDNKYGQDEIAIDNEAGTDYVSAGTLEDHTTFNDTATESEQLVPYEGNYSLRQVATVSVTGGEPLVVDLSDSTAVQNLLDTYFRRNDLASGTTYTAKAGSYLFLRNEYIHSINFQAGYTWQRLPYDPDTSTTMSINDHVSEIKLDHSETLALATEENPVEDVTDCYVYTYDDNQQLLDSEGNPLTAVSTTTYTTTVAYHSDFSSDSWYLKRVLKTYYSELDEELYYEDHTVVNAPTKTEIYSAESLIETDYSVPLDTAVYTREALPAEDTLPFIVSFTTGAYKWDLEMNDEVFNSYASERG